MATPFEIIECPGCGFHIYAGAISCYYCEQKADWFKNNMDKLEGR